MKFNEAVVAENNTTTTQNGAKAFVSTTNEVLDFFSRAAAMRNVDSTALFTKAFLSNEELALRALLWVRDVRGGAGERKVFRDNFKSLMVNNQITSLGFLMKVPEVGRWDDLLEAVGTEYEEEAFLLIRKALNDNNALCAKWMPRKGAVAEKLRKYLGLTPKQYRKKLVGLTSVVETKMCSNAWDKIDYKSVPSNAHNIYKEAFKKHSPDAYEEYKNKLTSGEVKINSSTLYPHQIVANLRTDEVIANAQWNNLPNYIPEGSNVLPMIDLSGSMECSASQGVTCMQVAIALGLYCSTKNEGAFKNMWLNFDSNPELQVLKGNSLSEAHDSLDFQSWGTSTNIDKAFQLILDVATKNKVKQEDMPDTLIIFSDMQFDAAGIAGTNFEYMKVLYKEAGYAAPNVVFWNLNAKFANSPCLKDDSGAMLVSGFSPAIMQAVLKGDFESISPEVLMLSVLLQDRYNF